MTAAHSKRGGEKLPAGKMKRTDATCGEKEKQREDRAVRNTATSHFSSPPRIFSSEDQHPPRSHSPVAAPRAPSRGPAGGEPRGWRKGTAAASRTHQLSVPPLRRLGWSEARSLRVLSRETAAFAPSHETAVARDKRSPAGVPASVGGRLGGPGC